MNDRISVTIDKGVADVRLARSAKMNALDDKLFDAIIRVGEDLHDNDTLRAVVLSGKGRVFCAGIDVLTLTAIVAGKSNTVPSKGVFTTGRLTPRTHGVANKFQYAAWLWRELPVPVIAAMHGVAFGAGLQIALGADMRYTTPDIQMSIMEIKWGLVPDMCGTQLLRHLTRDDVARELTYTGRIFSGEQALQYGLATKLFKNPLAAALKTAREIAGFSPNAIRANKQLLNTSRYTNVQDGLTMESRLQDQLIGSPNQLEAVNAELEKRPASFM